MPIECAHSLSEYYRSWLESKKHPKKACGPKKTPVHQSEGSFCVSTFSLLCYFDNVIRVFKGYACNVLIKHLCFLKLKMADADERDYERLRQMLDKCSSDSEVEDNDEGESDHLEVDEHISDSDPSVNLESEDSDEEPPPQQTPQKRSRREG